MQKTKILSLIIAFIGMVAMQGCTSDDNSSTAGNVSTTTSATGVGMSISEGEGLGADNSLIFTKDFTIAIVDSNGAGVEGASVNLSVTPNEFIKGAFVDDGSGAYTSVATTGDPFSRIVCPAETTDLNGNGNEDPTGVVSISGGTASLVTDASGRINFSLEYGREYGTWVRVVIRATYNAGGEDIVVTRDYQLSQLASVFEDSSINFPGDDSPYGPNASGTSTCSDLN